MVFHVTDEATIGSNPESTIRLKAGIVSDRHARLWYDKRKECYFLEDFKSFNGTKLDGEDVRGKKKKLVKYHILSFANVYEFTFQLVADTELPSAAQAPAAPAAPPVVDEAKMARTIVVDYSDVVQQLPEKTDVYYLEFRTSRAGDQSVLLKDGENTVGRLSTSDITIDNPSISRQHALVTVHPERVTVKDTGSRNGTFLDDARVDAETDIPAGAEIRFGLVRAVIVKKPREVRKA
jgi:pSer/pThr/pTyr-binding forkhead associated (FHA) protein